MIALVFVAKVMFQLFSLWFKLLLARLLLAFVYAGHSVMSAMPVFMALNYLLYSSAQQMFNYMQIYAESSDKN